MLCAFGVPSAPAANPATSADGPLDLAILRGKVVYLDFWASWGTPCHESFPWMNRLQAELGPEGLIVIAVNVDGSRSDADRFLREHPAQYRIMFDPQGDFPEKFGVRGMATSFLIRDRDALARQVRALVVAR